MRVQGFADGGDGRRVRGFTLIELLIVLLLVALLASLVAPVVTGSVQGARESVLKEDLHNMRKAIDDYYADTGNYPDALEVLVQKRYLRRVPVDPLTDRKDSWAFMREQREGQATGGGIVDVHSGAEGTGGDGRPYRDW